ncbi:DNA polymerase III subunit tau [Anatilimnocola aggregata]|uniref:DNA polymerase III subunit tau n=1 Tax=Anatilimnocola aggregata TaxID=2528021 RepID=A0A517YCP9_9BACT|nr:AAA family ATPase [Anatilimnocola aggregata]QDU28015.1 DNA polymerase III subunit tau [Anatilimnocola aggregata]
MSWQGIRGQDEVVERFRTALAHHRLASTFLFVGPEGCGKRLLAHKLAQSFLCEVNPEEALNPCGNCTACKQVLAGTHPDLDVIAKPEDKSSIPLEMLIGDKEHRMREGLCFRISLKPYSGRRKIAIIDDADFLFHEGANCLLKTLEEPPPKSILILLGTSEQRQLPTIRSRCQVVRFQPLVPEDIAAILLAQHVTDDPAAAQQAAAIAEGSVAVATRMLDAELAEFRSELLQSLSQTLLQPAVLVKLVQTFVDGAGKESAAKKQRLKDALGSATLFFRQLMLAASGASEATPALRSWPYGAKASATAVDLCLEASTAVDANASAANVLEWWADELATLQRTGTASLLSH